MGKICIVQRAMGLLLASLATAWSDENSYYNRFTVCSDSPFVVNEMQILCDSPGTYYYGSSKYRNSAKCQAGDKAKLEIQFQVVQDLSADAYLTLEVSGYGTIPSEKLYSSASICSISAISTQSNQNGGSGLCPNGYPRAGYYKLKQNFFWGTQNDSYEYSFIPKVTLGVSSSQGKSYYDLGGANTQACSGNTFTSWTTVVGKSASNTLHTFLITFGILTASVLSILLAGWLIMEQSKVRSKPFVSNHADDRTETGTASESDYHKIAMVSQNRDLVDF